MREYFVTASDFGGPRLRALDVGPSTATLHTAWRSAEAGDVLVLTKRSLFDSSTAYAVPRPRTALGQRRIRSRSANTRSFGSSPRSAWVLAPWP